jgi:hypothetical protein
VIKLIAEDTVKRYQEKKKKAEKFYNAPKDSKMVVLRKTRKGDDEE